MMKTWLVILAMLLALVTVPLSVDATTCQWPAPGCDVGASGSTSCDATTGELSITCKGAVAGGGDDLTAINNAISALEAAGQGGTVLFPAGEWHVSASPTISESGITFKGVGGARSAANSATIVSCTGTGTCLQVTDVNSFAIKDMHVRDTSVNTGTVGMEWKGVQNSLCERTFFTGFDAGGIRMRTSASASTIYNDLENCGAPDHTNAGTTAFALQMSEPDATKVVNQNVIRNFYGGGSDKCVQQVNDPAENTFIGIECGGSDSGMIITGRNTTVIGGTLESITNIAFNIPNGSTNASATIIGTVFQGNGTDINNPGPEPLCHMGTTLTATNAIECTEDVKITGGLGVGANPTGADINIASLIAIAGASALFKSGNDLRVGISGTYTRTELWAGGAEKVSADNTSTAGNTALLIFDVDNALVERVTVDAADSCGAGFKCLRIPN